MERFFRLYKVLFTFLILIFCFNNCADNGKLYGTALSQSSLEPSTIIPAQPTPEPISPPAQLIPDTFLANEYGGSGAMINSQINASVFLFQNSDNTNLVNRDGGKYRHFKAYILTLI